MFTANKTLQLDNFIKLKGFNWPGFRKQYLWKQDKGQSYCVRAFLASIELSAPPAIPAEELFEVAEISIEASAMLQSQKDDTQPMHLAY